MEHQLSENKAKGSLGMLMFLYMLGIFMGAIDTGIVTPARTVIQSGLGVNDKLGIWMITIFTLSYAASIPIAGKIADRIGRKYVYISCITLFGLGSLICGLSSSFSSFPILLTGRVIQAIGGGGIMPIANAELGTTFPEEKRGMALGLLGGVYGIANIMGSSIGSAILDIFGIKNWHFLFYINLPISVIIIVLGIIFLPVNKSTEAVGKVDIWGTLVIVSMILSLLYGLKNIDFFNFGSTIKSTSVYPFLIIFVVLLPIFILIEKKASDPILNLSYFTTPKILITLIVGFFAGVCMMGMIFVPQFSENSLRIATGKGGYFVTILGLFTAIGAPMSGKLVDKYGAKRILAGGFFVSLLGSLFLAFIAVKACNLHTVLISLGLIGLGLGFVMGSPLNYMMLGNTKKEDSNSALATLSLVRSVGTVIAPSIMIGFLAQAGISAQDNLMNMLPTPTAPVISQAVELNKTFTELKNNPQLSAMLKNVDIPDMSKMGEMKIDMKNDKALPADILSSLQSADVTNIVDKTKQMAVYMSDQNLPAAMAAAQAGVQKGIDEMSKGIASMKPAFTSPPASPSNSSKGTASAVPKVSSNGKHTASSAPQKAGKQGSGAPPSLMPAGAMNPDAIAAMKAQQQKFGQILKDMQELKDIHIPAAFKQSKLDYLDSIEKKRADIENSFQSTLGNGFKQMYLTVAIFCIASILLLMFYHDPKKKQIV